MGVPGHTLDANTLALWRLDETSAAAAAADATGRYNLPATNSPAVVAGKVAGARVVATTSAQSCFVSSTVTDGIFAAALIAGNWTVEMWALIDPAIAGNTFTWNNHNGTMFQAHGGLACILGMGTGGTWRIIAGGAIRGVSGIPGTLGANWTGLTRGTWHHIAFRGTATGGGLGLVEIFANSVKVATTAAFALPGSITNGQVAVGAEGTNFDNFVGTLDDVRVSTISRTDAEIAASFWNGYLDSARLPKSTPYRVYQTTPVSSGGLAPTFLTGPNAQAFEGALGDVKDFLSSKAKMAVQARMPLVAPSDALARIAIERGLQRGATETDAQLAVRCQGAWQTWPFAGTAFGLLQAFYQTGYQNVVLAQVRGGKQYTLDNGGVNLLRWSNRFDTASLVWTANQPYALATGILAPDGTLSATTLTAGAAQGGPFQNLTAPVSGKYVLHAWAQSAVGNQFFLRVRDNTTPASGLSTTFAGTAAWTRYSIQVTLAAGDSIDALFGVNTNGQAVNFADVQLEPAASPGPIARTFNVAKPTTLPAGSLLASVLPNGIWETDPLSSYSPLDQAFWSKFDVLFPLPLQAPSFSWSAGIPSSSSNEANFIRALISAWKPAFAITNRIIIQQSGKLLGYPPTATLGSTNGVLGGSSTVWTP